MDWMARGRAFRSGFCSVRGGDHGSRRRRGGFHLLHSDGRDDDVVGHLADDARARVRRTQSSRGMRRAVAVAGARRVRVRARRRERRPAGSERRTTNERVRLVGAGAQTLATYFTRHLLIGREHLPARLLLATCAVRCALVFAQAVAVPCGSLTKETTCVTSARSEAALVADPGEIVLSRIPSVSFCVTLIATFVAQ